MSSIVEKLESISARFNELGVALTNPAVVSDNARFSQVSREYRKLEKIVDVYKLYRTNLDNLEFARDVLNNEQDEELRDLAKADIEPLEKRGEELEEELEEEELELEEDDSSSLSLIS